MIYNNIILINKKITKIKMSSPKERNMISSSNNQGIPNSSTRLEFRSAQGKISLPIQDECNQIQNQLSSQNQNGENETHKSLEKQNYNEPIEEPEKNSNTGKIILYCILYSLKNIFISLFDFLTFLICPLIRLSEYSIIVACGLCVRVCYGTDIETPDMFTVVPSREEDIVAFSESGSCCYKTSGQCFAQLTMCFARYFCCFCVLWEHCVLTFQVAYRQAKEKFTEPENDNQAQSNNENQIQNSEQSPNQVILFGQNSVQQQAQINNNGIEIKIKTKQVVIAQVEPNPYQRTNFNDLPDKIIQ